MRKMAGDFDNTLTSLQKAQSEKQLLQQQLSSQQAELDRVREEVKEKERVWEEERVDVRRRAKEFAELEESVTQLREVSAKVVVGVACCYGYHAPPQELDKLGAHTGEEQTKQNSSLLSQVSWVVPG